MILIFYNYTKRLCKVNNGSFKILPNDYVEHLLTYFCLIIICKTNVIMQKVMSVVYIFLTFNRLNVQIERFQLYSIQLYYLYAVL